MKILDYAGLQYLYGKLLARLNNKVDKVTGKGLSTNDYTRKSWPGLQRERITMRIRPALEISISLPEIPVARS